MEPECATQSRQEAARAPQRARAAPRQASSLWSLESNRRSPTPPFGRPSIRACEERTSGRRDASTEKPRAPFDASFTGRSAPVVSPAPDESALTRSSRGKGDSEGAPVTKGESRWER